MPFEKKPGLRNPKILQKIFELRNQRMGFPNISKAISEEFGINITHPTTKNLYYEYAAKQKMKAEADGVDDKWDNLLNQKFERIEKITNTLLDAVETIKDKLTPELYLEYAPTIIAILRESLNQLAFIRREQEQITIKQQNLIYSPLQIMQQINQLEETKKKDKVFIIPNKAGEKSSSGKKEVEKEKENVIQTRT